jgi:hypothetical protein
MVGTQYVNWIFGEFWSKWPLFRVWFELPAFMKGDLNYPVPLVVWKEFLWFLNNRLCLTWYTAHSQFSWSRYMN